MHCRCTPYSLITACYQIIVQECICYTVLKKKIKKIIFIKIIEVKNNNIYNRVIVQKTCTYLPLQSINKQYRVHLLN